MAKKKKSKSKVRVMKATQDPVKKPYQQIAYTPVQLQELKRCSEDIFYFIENYVYIVDPVKGNVLFKLHDYQRAILQGFLDNRNTIVMAGRQLGKSTVSVAYLLWEAMFKSEQTILVVSNVFSAAGEIMERVRYSYELLPDWLKPGVSVYNKASITFDNKSRVIARATTKNSGRGLSLSVLYVDELSAVDTKKAKEFWSAIRPTLSTGGKCIITSTPSSDEDLFATIWRASLNTFDDHGIEIPNGIGRNGFKAIKYTWRAHPDRDDQWERDERSAMGDDEKFEREHNCDFVGADETLINAMVLMALNGKDPIEVKNNVRWYQRPQANRTYLIGLDPSMGTGRDYAAIQVWQLPEMVQIAEWQHNKTAIPQQVKVLREIIQYIQESQKLTGGRSQDAEIYWTVENNSIGEAANIVIKEIGEDVIGGVYLSAPGKGTNARRKGYTMTNKLKLEACSRFKSLIERNKMHINSKALISQLKLFVSSGASYKGKGSENDDLVMACLLIIKMLERIMSFDDLFRENFSESADENGSGEGSREPLWGVF